MLWFWYLEKDMVELGKIQRRQLKLLKGLKGVTALWDQTKIFETFQLGKENAVVRLVQGLWNHEGGWKNEYGTIFHQITDFGSFGEISLKHMKITHYLVASENFWICCQKRLWKQVPTAGSNRNWTSSCTTGPKMDSKRTRQGSTFLTAMEARGVQGKRPEEGGQAWVHSINNFSYCCCFYLLFCLGMY